MSSRHFSQASFCSTEECSSVLILDDCAGKIPYYTLPPIRNEGENLEVAILSELGKEFNVDDVYKGESSFIGSLVSAEDFKHVVVPSSSPLNMDVQMLEVR